MSSQRSSSDNVAPAKRVTHLLDTVSVPRPAGVVAVGVSA